MEKYLILLISSLVIGCFIGVIGMYFLNQIIGPSHSDTEFVRICGELNGKKFTFQNTQPLNGSCFIPVVDGIAVETCREKHINDYLKSGSVALGIDISQGPLDGSWRCNLTYIEKDSTIKAIPHYVYD